MTEELQLKAQEALIRMLNGLDSAMDFTVEQAPLVVQELLRWNFVYSLAMFTFWATLLVVPTIGWWKVYKYKFINGGEIKDPFDFLTAMAFFASLLLYPASLIMLFSTLDWLQIWLAPRVWLLEYAASLVK